MLAPVVLAWKPMRGPHFLASLRDYLQERLPDALVAAAPNSNLVAVWARRLSGMNCRTLSSERSAPSQMLTKPKKWLSRFLPGLMRHTYPHADVIVSVSSGLGMIWQPSWGCLAN